MNKKPANEKEIKKEIDKVLSGLEGTEFYEGCNTQEVEVSLDTLVSLWKDIGVARSNDFADAVAELVNLKVVDKEASRCARELMDALDSADYGFLSSESADEAERSLSELCELFSRAKYEKRS